MDLASDEFRKKFPNLAKELAQNTMRARIDSVRTEVKDDKNSEMSGYVPDIVDFLRRCDTAEEAEEIIGFTENRGEISQEYAARLRTQLRERGLRSFGPKKEWGHYLKQAKV